MAWFGNVPYYKAITTLTFRIQPLRLSHSHFKGFLLVNEIYIIIKQRYYEKNSCVIDDHIRWGYARAWRT
jgi:hypothetical protein